MSAPYDYDRRPKTASMKGQVWHRRFTTIMNEFLFETAEEAAVQLKEEGAKDAKAHGNTATGTIGTDSVSIYFMSAGAGKITIHVVRGMKRKEMQVSLYDQGREDPKGLAGHAIYGSDLF